MTSHAHEDADLVVKESPVEGLGLFTKRAFKKGETVVVWHPKRITDDEWVATPPEERRYLGKLADGTRVLMQPPERYVNSSDEPNTSVSGQSDVAVRDIAAGEEVFSNYPLTEAQL